MRLPTPEELRKLATLGEIEAAAALALVTIAEIAARPDAGDVLDLLNTAQQVAVHLLTTLAGS